MVSLDQVLLDVDGSVSRRSGEDRVRTLRRITDLFVGGATAFDDEQVELFDVVIGRFAATIETRARVDLAERLAGLANAPPGVIRSLAEDDIVVARPVLAASPRLDDQALMAIALAKGRDHMLAICERPSVSPCVTDVLVSGGDGVVRHAIAGNRGARFSVAGVAQLVGHSRRDGALGGLLAGRGDLPPETLRQLIEIAKDTARASLLAALPGADRAVASAVERGASGIGVADAMAVRGPGGARAAVRAMLGGQMPSEADIARFAAEDRPEEMIALISSLTGLSLDCLERIFAERENDLLMVIGKARGWSWPTVRALLSLRDPSLTERHQFRRAEETFEGLAVATAGRVLHFLKVRETAGARSSARPDRVRYG